MINAPDMQPRILTLRHRAVSMRRYAPGSVGRVLACLLACCLVASQVPRAWAQGGVEDGGISREYPLKALFLYNFGGYVEWPPEAFATPQSPFVIGVLGTAPLNPTLSELAASKTIAGRKIVVDYFVTADKIRPCQILFISRTVTPQQQRAAIEKLKQTSVLIVGEVNGFARMGGAVNFYIEANKVRLEINPEAAKDHQLKISSKLLSLAKIVQGTENSRQ